MIRTVELDANESLKVTMPNGIVIISNLISITQVMVYQDPDNNPIGYITIPEKVS